MEYLVLALLRRSICFAPSVVKAFFPRFYRYLKVAKKMGKVPKGTAARSSAYVSISLPSHVWSEPPMPPPVVRDDAIAMLPKEQHLPVPVIRGQRPAMRKHDRLSLSPVLIVNLRAVFGRDSAHSLKNGTVTQSYRIQHHIPALPCLRLVETLQGASEAFVHPKTPARC
jgi:hypothetical protein